MVSRLNMSMLSELEEEEDYGAVEKEQAVHVDGSTVAPALRARVTEAMIDESVDHVLGKASLPEETKEAFRMLLARDVDAAFATSYFSGKAKQDQFVASQKLGRKKITLHSTTTGTEVADLVKYAPEYDLVFADDENHCHGAGAAMRKVDTHVLLDNRPGVPFKDVGGDPLVYIRMGIEEAHVCDPFEDPKDPTRHVVREMVARKILNDRNWPIKSRKMAARYLDRDSTFVCGKLGQNCSHKAKFTMSVHVYDIQLQDWPTIMHNSGAKVHSGTVHFSPEMYSSTSGVLSASRAEYQVDVENDTFLMGFKGSPSWWYQHSWMLFMRYGCDQIIEHESGRYSYKIVQRRGDTVYFEIMKVEGNSRIEQQCYRLPDVKMVEVEGFELSDGRSWDPARGKYVPLRPTVYKFPASLWADMLVQAMSDFERKVMSFDKLYNYYRTVSPRNTVNGVLLHGGNAVEMDLVVPLVVHVGLVAAARVTLGQRESRYTTAKEMSLRAMKGRSSLQKIMGGLTKAVEAMSTSMVSGASWLVDRFVQLTDDALVDTLVRWSVEPEIKDVPFSSLIGTVSEANKQRWQTYQFEELYDGYRTVGLASQAGDHRRAMEDSPLLSQLMRDLYGDGPAKRKTVVPNAGVSEGSHTACDVDQEEVVYVASPSELLERKAAIQEAIDESDLEEKKIVEACRSVYAACTDGAGAPQVHALTTRAEEFGQPDFWFINGGVITNSSVLDADIAGFPYSAVFIPGKSGEEFWSVREQTSSFQGRVKEHFVISNHNYTGWAMVLDRLVIYNGPDIRNTLMKALDAQHNYRVVIKQGPPGCGKTYTLVHMMEREDVALCPVREAAVDTRARVSELFDGRYPDVTNRVSSLDSYLKNYDSPSKSKLRAHRLLADECYMTTAGKWYAAAALLGASEIVAFGDVNQIPHIPRVQASSIYLRIKPQVCEVEYVTRRCPWDALASWGEIYEWQVRSSSSVKSSLSVATDWRGLTIPSGLVVLVMYQEGKKAAREALKVHMKEKRIQIMSVHEAEGKTFDDVWLFRFDVRPRSDKLSLYDQQAHCLVAMSRHRRSFVYIRTKNVGDLVDKWIVRGQDYRRANRAGDMASVGRSLEF